MFCRCFILHVTTVLDASKTYEEDFVKFRRNTFCEKRCLSQLLCCTCCVNTLILCWCQQKLPASHCYHMGHVASSFTWPLESRYTVSIGSQFEPTVYLALLSRYGTSKILGPWAWRFGVTWRRRLRDHWTRKVSYRFETNPISRMLPEIFVSNI